LKFQFDFQFSPKAVLSQIFSQGTCFMVFWNLALLPKDIF